MTTGWSALKPRSWAPASRQISRPSCAQVKVAKVYDVESSLARALYSGRDSLRLSKSFSIRSSPSWCSCRTPIRFATSFPNWPRLSDRSVISDCIGYKYEGGKADVHPSDVSGEVCCRCVALPVTPPYFATFRTAHSGVTKLRWASAPAPVETVQVADRRQGNP